MFGNSGNSGLIKTTSHKVVLPFYVYAAISFLTATGLMLFNTPAFLQHYFHPHTLAITHIMALGWGTMIILGASHQLVPVLIDGKLYSDSMALISFVFASLGIPMLVYGFFEFNIGWPAQWGGSLVVGSVFIYLLNLSISILKSKKGNVHVVFVFTAAVWLLITTSVGLLLVFNFSSPFLPRNSLTYLPLHAHLGIAGWFLLLIMGVGSRLIPMFLISKYDNTRLLWWIYGLVNGGVLCFAFGFLFNQNNYVLLVPIAAVFSAILLFIFYCREAYSQRIRRKVDEQMKVSLLSVMMILIPIVILLIVIISLLVHSEQATSLVLMYGFAIFFGWITAIILGMTFKTLPFIVWNKIYHHHAGTGKTPNPKDLFSDSAFKYMSIAYLGGLILFSMGIVTEISILLQVGAIFLLITAILYNWNVIRTVMHKPVFYEYNNQQ